MVLSEKQAFTLRFLGNELGSCNDMNTRDRYGASLKCRGHSVPSALAFPFPSCGEVTRRACDLRH